jgi:hypothetical protein
VGIVHIEGEATAPSVSTSVPTPVSRPRRVTRVTPRE